MLSGGGIFLWMFFDLFLLLIGKLKDSEGKKLHKEGSIFDLFELFS